MRLSPDGDAEARATIARPPSLRCAARKKSAWPPTAPTYRPPASSEFSCPNRSTSTAELIGKKGETSAVAVGPVCSLIGANSTMSMPSRKA